MKRLMYVLFFVLLTSGMAYAQQAKYVFYFIGDGMGVNLSLIHISEPTRRGI